ncbi:MAG: hypothetical protein WD628_00230, partial [Thermomicrobiales bacterium]
SRTEALAREALAASQPLYTLATDDDANANLIALGAVPIGTRAASWPPDLTTGAPIERATTLRDHQPSATSP